MSAIATISPAEQASEQALAAVYACLEHGEHFLLEAGAGAGKTYSLVQALRFLIERHAVKLVRRYQKVACITFTNVAKEEIESRIDRDPLIYCDTIHGFCWSLVGGFQKQLRAQLPSMPHWPERIEEAGGIADQTVEYSLGYRSINDRQISLHHDDVLLLTAKLFENEKFRRIVSSRYPIILIDEYQDTNANWVAGVKEHFLATRGSSQFGFFGDHWQKIYGDGCGRIEHPALHLINKHANFRSVLTVVECLNRMRPELPQFVKDPTEVGSVRVFHTNGWVGTRQTGAHWGGDLPSEVAHAALQGVKATLQEDGWDLSAAATKILMLTHRVLATEQGYRTLPQIFRFNEAFTKKEHAHIAFFVDHLEPAVEAFAAKRFGAMFGALDYKASPIAASGDKKRWASSMNELSALRTNGTIGQVIDHLRATRRPQLPDDVEQRERELDKFDAGSGEEIPLPLEELKKLRNVPYSEIVALAGYHRGYSPFETKHGVKGAEFENVLVVIGRGWSMYNFGEMLELAADVSHLPSNRREAFERNRNLFYVACSRPKKRLAILFTQKLSVQALATVEKWFGPETVESLVL